MICQQGKPDTVFSPGNATGIIRGGLLENDKQETPNKTRRNGETAERKIWRKNMWADGPSGARFNAGLTNASHL